MDDSDDYAFDDIDDTDLSVINAIESKFVTASQPPRPNAVLSPSPAPVTSNAWSDEKPTSHGVNLHGNKNMEGGHKPPFRSFPAPARPVIRSFASTITTEEFDDIPEISVTSDGSYVVASSSSKGAASFPTRPRFRPPNEGPRPSATPAGGAGAWGRKPAELRTTADPSAPRKDGAKKPAVTSRTAMAPPLRSASSATSNSDVYMVGHAQSCRVEILTVVMIQETNAHPPDDYEPKMRPTAPHHQITHAGPPSTADAANDPLAAQLAMVRAHASMTRNHIDRYTAFEVTS